MSQRATAITYYAWIHLLKQHFTRVELLTKLYTQNVSCNDNPRAGSQLRQHEHNGVRIQVGLTEACQEHTHTHRHAKQYTHRANTTHKTTAAAGGQPCLILQTTTTTQKQRRVHSPLHRDTHSHSAVHNKCGTVKQ